MKRSYPSGGEKRKKKKEGEEKRKQDSGECIKLELCMGVFEMAYCLLSTYLLNQYILHTEYSKMI